MAPRILFELEKTTFPHEQRLPNPRLIRSYQISFLLFLVAAAFERTITRCSYRFSPFHKLRHSIAYIIALQDVTNHLWNQSYISYKSFFILLQISFTIVFFAFTKEIIANTVVNDF